MQLDDIFVLQLPESFDLLCYHVGHFHICAKVQDFNGDLLFDDLVISQENRAKPALTKFALDIDEFHPDLVIKILA